MMRLAVSGSGTLLLEPVLPLLSLDSFRVRVQYLRVRRMFLELQQEIQYVKDQTTFSASSGTLKTSRDARGFRRQFQ